MTTPAGAAVGLGAAGLIKDGGKIEDRVYAPGEKPEAKPPVANPDTPPVKPDKDKPVPPPKPVDNDCPVENGNQNTVIIRLKEVKTGQQLSWVK